MSFLSRLRNAAKVVQTRAGQTTSSLRQAAKTLSARSRHASSAGNQAAKGLSSKAKRTAMGAARNAAQRFGKVKTATKSSASKLGRAARPMRQAAVRTTKSVGRFARASKILAAKKAQQTFRKNVIDPIQKWPLSSLTSTVSKLDHAAKTARHAKIGVAAFEGGLKLEGLTRKKAAIQAITGKWETVSHATSSKWDASRSTFHKVGSYSEKAGKALSAVSLGLVLLKEGKKNWHLARTGSWMDKGRFAREVGYAGGREFVGSKAGAVGAAKGAVVGAKIGALVGSVVPGPGTAIGAGVGAVIGAIGGYMLTKKAVQTGMDVVFSPGVSSAKERTDQVTSTARNVGIAIKKWLKKH